MGGSAFWGGKHEKKKKTRAARRRPAFVEKRPLSLTLSLSACERVWRGWGVGVGWGECLRFLWGGKMVEGQRGGGKGAIAPPPPNPPPPP